MTGVPPPLLLDKHLNFCAPFKVHTVPFLHHFPTQCTPLPLCPLHYGGNFCLHVSFTYQVIQPGGRGHGLLISASPAPGPGQGAQWLKGPSSTAPAERATPPLQDLTRCIMVGTLLAQDPCLYISALPDPSPKQAVREHLSWEIPLRSQMRPDNGRPRSFRH